MSISTGNDVSQRMKVMVDSLSKHELEIDMKNEIILQYIFLGEGAMFIDAVKIASDLAEQKFLVEYCDVRTGYRVAKNQCSGIRLSHSLWRQRVVACILLTKDLIKFPDTWPWMQSMLEIHNPVNEPITSALYFGKRKQSFRKSRHFTSPIPRRASETRYWRHPI